MYKNSYISDLVFSKVSLIQRLIILFHFSFTITWFSLFFLRLPRYLVGIGVIFVIVDIDLLWHSCLSPRVDNVTLPFTAQCTRYIQLQYSPRHICFEFSFLQLISHYQLFAGCSSSIPLPARGQVSCSYFPLSNC